MSTLIKIWKNPLFQALLNAVLPVLFAHFDPTGNPIGAAATGSTIGGLLSLYTKLEK